MRLIYIGRISKQLILKMKGSVIMKGIKQWYVATYPGDELGYELSDYATFYDLHHGIVHGYDVYGFLGVNDSLVRERIFLELSNVMNIEYETIYTTWINNLK